MKTLRRLLLALAFSSLAVFAQGPPGTITVNWSWSQGTGSLVASQFNVMQALVSGGCAQLPAGSATLFNVTTCTQIGTVAASVFTYTTQPTADASHTADPLTQGQTYCYVVVAQSSTGAAAVVSQDSDEQCGTVKKTLSAPTVAPLVLN